MVISRDALKATDQARGPGAIRGFIPCELDHVEGLETVHEPMVNRSVVMIRLLMSAPNCGSTTDKWYRQDQKAIPSLRRGE